MDRNNILNVVIKSAQNVVDTFDESDRFTVHENTLLFGENSKIDSLSLVSIIVSIEDYFIENGYDISLTDDQAMMQEKSPFSDVNTLTNYIVSITNR